VTSEGEQGTALAPQIIVVMGVSGAGKTTVGQLLAEDLGWPFYEGDDYHPQANVEKMSQGIPLTDEDRAVWLDRLRALIDGLLAAGGSAVVACSALKRSYRQHLGRDRPAVRFVYLKGSQQLIRRRMEERQDHFMEEDLLADQFETLEEPSDMLTVSVDKEPDDIVAEIRARLDLKAGALGQQASDSEERL
jgi:gluconokinase